MINQVAPCGIDCLNCELYEANNNTTVWARLAAMTSRSEDEIKCKGCRLQGGCTIQTDCETLACVQEKGIDFCYQCDDFPCSRLQPAADSAERLPHNLKVFNLCTIQRDGLASFLENARQHRALYFAGKMKIGAGPQSPVT